VDIQLAIHDGEIIASVTDAGTWTPHGLHGPAARRGRGIALMQKLVDHIRVDTTSQGTTITLRKTIPPK